MEHLDQPDYIDKQELIYWIDKWFVQETAQATIGKEMNDEELKQFKKLIEFGLWDVVFDTIRNRQHSRLSYLLPRQIEKV